jgi:hypothetical protein
VQWKHSPLSRLAAISAPVRRLKRGASGVVDVPDVTDGAVKSKGLDGGRYGDDQTVEVCAEESSIIASRCS